MTKRAAELRDLAAELAEHEAVVDAFVAKSFTDRLLIVDTRRQELHDDIRERLAAHECYGSEKVYREEESGPTFASEIGDATRHHFVDIETRGAHQSYVVD